MKRMCFATVLTLVFGLTAITTNAEEAAPENSLKNEPEYKCDEPLYGLAVFGADNEKPIWIVLDKSNNKQKIYDTMYVDLNSNGDLTEANESFSLDKDNNSINIPDLKISDESSFSEIKLSLSTPTSSTCMFKATWNGKEEEINFGGGYPETTKNGYMILAKEKSEAPIVYFKGGAPLEFQPWYQKPLKIGGATDFKVFMGHRGRGPSSFCTTLGHILADDEPILATLNYVDKDGDKKRADVKLKERC